MTSLPRLSREVRANPIVASAIAAKANGYSIAETRSCSSDLKRPSFSR